MKTNLKYSIYGLLFSLILNPPFLICLIVSISEKSWILSVFWSVLLLTSIFLLFDAIRNIQWFKIRNGSIIVYSLFGIVKCVQFDQIKNAFSVNAVIFRLKALTFYRPHIVLCLNKSTRKSEIEDAYNRKKRKYIIIPYTEETKILIQTECRKYCNQSLEIKGI